MLSLNQKKEASGAASLSRMADLIVHLGLSKPWNIAHLLSVEREESIKKPIRGGMGFSIVYKKLIFKVIKIAFRIRCIMLI